MSPINELDTAYDSLYRQPLATIGWEDGLHISDDGLHLYCTYVPIDFLSFVLNGNLPNDFSTNYLRSAPTFGMDLSINPIGAAEWLHSDILYAHRNSVLDSFKTWRLSDMARSFYSEGAPTPSYSINTNLVEIMLFTSNDNASNNTDIWFIKNTSINPSGIGSPMPTPINSIYNEDNPHLVRLDQDKLVLFFDSDNLPGGSGDHDIWFAESDDNGSSWTVPSNVTTINSMNKEHQPFLYHDIHTHEWYLYYSAFHTDGKLAIFRTKQTITNDWNSWGSSQLVISAGNTAGIGEPTLTKNGDISFVVIYSDPNETSIYNHFDSDPWFLEKTKVINATNNKVIKPTTSIYPNPAKEFVNIDVAESIERVTVYNHIGEICLVSTQKKIKTDTLTNGFYLVSILFNSGKIELKSVIINK